jgi:hypothetical protein
MMLGKLACQRVNGIHEVVGSIPSGSTKLLSISDS